ncbi:MAG: PDZ domain-containing protein, partial [Candidatus Marinimicrobia bacterium]|nr:PDZ domain-containing protein [Candidatus Neomarinimicrobiota bacterium]
GSGFIVSEDGFIYTNYHVVEGADEIVITTAGGERHDAEIIGLDRVTDLALLKIDVTNAPTADLGNSDDVIIGEWVIALGNPFGLFDVSFQPTATAGIVSGVDMDFGMQEGKNYQDMIQTDASINSGNSGGPLVNAEGDVIGINTFIFTGGGYSQGSVGVGFAIPINRVVQIMAELKEKGEINWRFTTGFSFQEIDRDLARALNLPINGGLLIKSVERGEPAARAGLQVGDVIIEAEGVQIRSEQDIRGVVEQNYLHVGDALNLTVWRRGEEIEIELTLGADS